MKRGDDSMSYRLKQSHSKDFKKALQDYAVAYNREHGTAIRIRFPTPFTLTILEPKRKPR